MPVFGRPEAGRRRKIAGGGGGAAGDHRTVPAHLRGYRPPDLCRRNRTLAGECRQTVWQFHDRFHAGDLREAFALLRKAGVEPHAFLEIMSVLFGSPIYANYGRLVADGQFEPAGFALRLGLKDVRLVLEAAGEFAAPMPFASLMSDHFLDAMAHGQAELELVQLHSRVRAERRLE